jgi:N-acetylmuramoyl-L-alanine amidase
VIELLLLLAFALQDLDHHAVRAWHARSVLLLGIADDIKPLPWSLVNGVDPQSKPERRLLPLEYYESADRERNRRLYGRDTVMLFPTMVVLHFTVVDDAEMIIRAFSRPSVLAVGNQRPVTSLISVHYMVDKDGTVYQLAEEDRTTSGTYGVDHIALAIEIVAKDEKDLMSRPLQLLAAFSLTDRLLKKYDLPVWRVFSHQEVALGEFFLSDYTDLADTETPYFYPEPHFRYDPGHTVMAWAREFLLRRRKLWDKHPASGD